MSQDHVEIVRAAFDDFLAGYSEADWTEGVITDWGEGVWDPDWSGRASADAPLFMSPLCYSSSGPPPNLKHS